jgi:hypothetical protein
MVTPVIADIRDFLVRKRSASKAGIFNKPRTSLPISQIVLVQTIEITGDHQAAIRLGTGT